ncbi:MAG: hypothetical protein KJ057_16335 [Phycisphaerae bacterium]|nr:hypothetical protein [Planctomycetia bacterium]MCL4720037.1 hypothetical protein [Phycisphaerae bacterium]
MAPRRSLTEGIKSSPSLDAETVKQFVHQGQDPEPATETKINALPQTQTTSSVPTRLGKVPFSLRMRTDYAQALKRASLERQLSGIKPNTLQDIMEQAIEPWLKEHGYLP